MSISSVGLSGQAHGHPGVGQVPNQDPHCGSGNNLIEHEFSWKAKDADQNRGQDDELGHVIQDKAKEGI